MDFHVALRFERMGDPAGCARKGIGERKSLALTFVLRIPNESVAHPPHDPLSLPFILPYILLRRRRARRADGGSTLGPCFENLRFKAFHALRLVVFDVIVTAQMKQPVNEQQAYLKKEK